MYRRPLLLPASLLVAAALAACSGSPATQAPGTTPAAPGVTQAPAATSNPGVATPAGPPATPATPAPLVADPELAARMPQSLGGDPCDNQAYTWASYAASFPAFVDLFQPLLTATGLNGSEISLGEGSCDVVTSDGSTFSVSYDSMRVRGGDAAKVAQVLPAISAQINNEAAPTVTPASMGGRSGAIVTEEDGNKKFLWVSGDALFEYELEDDPTVDNLVVSSFPG